MRERGVLFGLCLKYGHICDNIIIIHVLTFWRIPPVPAVHKDPSLRLGADFDKPKTSQNGAKQVIMAGNGDTSGLSPPTCQTRRYTSNAILG